MADLYWEEERNRFWSLYTGCLPEPIAHVWPSNKGKKFTHHILLPTLTRPRKQWQDLDKQKEEVEAIARNWLDFASMDRPATDKPECE